MNRRILLSLVVVAFPMAANADLFRTIEATHNAGLPMTTVMTVEPAKAWEDDFGTDRGVALILDGRWSPSQPNLGLARWDWRRGDQRQGGWLAIWVENGKVARWWHTDKPPRGKHYTDAMGQAADVGSTAAALSSGLAEANALVAGAGLPVAAAVKIGGTAIAHHSSYPACRDALPALGSLGWGATLWNVGMIAGAGPVAAVPAVATAVAAWRQDRFWECVPSDLVAQNN